jgi:DNA polymerase gamma 1
MQYLTRLYNIPSRLLLTIHDEVRFLVRTEHQYRLAACLQIANLWTRAMFVHRLGMRELPLSVAFFSAVDFDHVLRKEPSITCQTPSNPDPIPPGHSLDVYGLMEKLGGSGNGTVDPEFLRWWRSTSMLVSTKSMPLECRQTILDEKGPNRLGYLKRQANLPRTIVQEDVEGKKAYRPPEPTTPTTDESSGAEAKMATAWKNLLRNQQPLPKH